MRPHRQQPTRLPRPWDSPGKNTEVGCHFLLQCMKVKSESEVTQSCPTLSDPMDCSPPGSSVHGIFQARELEWGAIAFPDLHVRGSLILAHGVCQIWWLLILWFRSYAGDLLQGSLLFPVAVCPRFHAFLQWQFKWCSNPLTMTRRFLPPLPSPEISFSTLRWRKPSLINEVSSSSGLLQNSPKSFKSLTIDHGKKATL